MRVFFACLCFILISANLVFATDYAEYIFPAGSLIFDDDSPPAMSIVESTGTGTMRFRIMDFDPDTDEICYTPSFVLPANMTASADWVIEYYWFTNDTGADEDCIWGAQVSATSEGDADAVTEQAADADIAYVAENCNATEANRLIITSQTLTYATYLDSAAAGDDCQVAIRRDADNTKGDSGGDGLTSDARLKEVRIKIPVN